MAEKMPSWMEEEQGGEHCDVDFPEGDTIKDDEIDDEVLTASAKTAEEKKALREQYAQLFPAKAVGIPDAEVT